jgi:hypothetical protein
MAAWPLARITPLPIHCVSAVTAVLVEVGTIIDIVVVPVKNPEESRANHKAYAERNNVSLHVMGRRLHHAGVVTAVQNNFLAG